MGFPKGRALEMVKEAMANQKFKEVTPKSKTPASAPKPTSTPTPSPTSTTTPPATAITTTTTTPTVPRPGTKLTPTAANGFITPTHYWTQSLTELTVYIPNLPPKTTSKCCKIAIKPSSLSVIVSDRKLLVGEFERKVNLSECIWSLDKEANTLQINLEKVEKTWWASPTKEDLYKIDCGKVDSTMRVDEYDESTQGKIREIMYQQNEERRKIASGEVQPPIPPHLADRERNLSLD